MEGLAGGFNIVRSYGPNPVRCKGCSSGQHSRSSRWQWAPVCVTREAETFASSGLYSFARSVARSREQSRFLGAACAVLYGSLYLE